MFHRAAPAAAAPAAAPAEHSEEGYAPRVAIVALADLLPSEGVGSDAFYVAADAFGESLLGCGAALLELSAEEQLILEGALLAARAFFDGPEAGKTPHAAPAAAGEGWHRDSKTGNEELGCRMNGNAALLPPVVAPWAARACVVLGAAARASLGALSRAPVLGLRPGAGGLGRLLQDAPLPRGARGASLLVSSRHAAEGPASPPCATHLGLLALLALQPGAALELQPPAGSGARPVRVATPPGLVAVLAGETLHYATAGGVRPVPYRVVAAGGAHPPPLALALRVHGEPAAVLPAGSGIFSACGDVAAFERLRLAPPPPPQPQPAAAKAPAAAAAAPAGGAGVSVAGGMTSNVTGATVHITADTISISSAGGTSVLGGGATGGGGAAFNGGGTIGIVGGGGGGGGGWGLASGGKSPAPAPASEPQLRLSVQDAVGGELRFLVPLSAPLLTVFDVYCAKRSVPVAQARFMAGRAQLNPASTVREAGLRDGDIIVMERDVD